MEIFSFLHQEINKPLLLFLNSLTENIVLSKIVYFMADWPIFVIPIFLVWFWIYKRKNNQEKQKLLFIFYSTFLAILISLIIQQFVDISRPEESIYWASRLILKHIPDTSFPSDHASVSIAFFVSLILFWFTKFALILLPFFIIMLLSRVAWGVHWPFDIIFWSIIWIISAFIIYKLKDLNILKVINNFILKLASYFKL